MNLFGFSLSSSATSAAPAIAADSTLERELMKRLQQDPDDLEARVRLLEHYFRNGREERFLRQAAIYRSCLRGNEETADWSQIRSLGTRLFPDSPLFQEAGSAPGRQRRFGEGGRGKKYFEALAPEYARVRANPEFLVEVDRELIQAAGRPTPLRHARRLSEHLGGAQLYFKREDFAMPGSQLQFHITGQALLARRLGRKTLVTSTSHGQRGVAVAAVAARLGMSAVVYMESHTIAANPANVFRMWLSGAQVVSVDDSPMRGKDVRESALMHCLNQPADTFLVMGLDAGPEPYPAMARDFLAVAGRESRRQMLGLARRLPDLVVTRAGDNADALGLFPAFLDDARVRLACVEGDKALPTVAPGASVAPDAGLTADQQQIADSVMEGLLFPSVAREHLWLRQTGRIEYPRVDGAETVETIQLLSRFEGIVPPIETAHAVAWACREARRLPTSASIVVGLAENSDKDILRIGRALGVPL